MRGKFFVVLAGVLLGICFASVSSAVEASFQGLGNLPGEVTESIAYDVSGDGTVVVGGTWGSECFRWTEYEGMQSVDADALNAYGVSADGTIIVGSCSSESTGMGLEAYRWTEASGLLRLGDLPTANYGSIAWNISGDGLVIVGVSGSYLGEEGFRWTAGEGMVGLGDLPGGSFKSEALACSADGSVIVGRSNSTESGGGYYDWESFIWTESVGMVSLGDLPGGRYKSCARDVSADGSIVVGDCMNYGQAEAFRWTEAEGMVGLGGYRAYGISADGSIVVGSGAEGACIWDSNNNMYNFKELLENEYSLDLGDWILVSARDVSDDNLTIVGHGINPQGLNEAWIATIPEPVTILLLGIEGLFLRRKTLKNFGKGEV